MVFDRHNLEYVALSRPGLVTLPGDIAEEHIVIGVRKGQEALLEEVNGFIRAYRADGTYAEMRKRWFAVNRPPMPAIARPEAPTRTLRVGMEPMSEPTCFMGEEGPTGFDVEMALRLGAALNARMELVVLPFSGMIAALESGKIDLIISSLNATPERGEKILFSEDYLDTGICVLTRRAALAEGQIASKDQLAGKRVGVLSGTTMDAIARRDLPGYVPVYYNNFADLPIALKSGKIEAFLMEQPQAWVLVKQQRGVTFLPEMLSSDAYAVLFAKDRAALCEAFSAEIRKMKADGTLAALDEKWFSNDPARQTLRGWSIRRRGRCASRRWRSWSLSPSCGGTRWWAMTLRWYSARRPRWGTPSSPCRWILRGTSLRWQRARWISAWAAPPSPRNASRRFSFRSRTIRAA